MGVLRTAGIGCFVIGTLPLLAFTFFSPGLNSEGMWGYAVFGFGIMTVVLLAIAAVRYRWFWGLVLIQIFLLVLTLYETFSDAALYIGT